jgi:5-methylcytosine-specific restriction endonuclease McrA
MKPNYTTFAQAERAAYLLGLLGSHCYYCGKDCYKHGVRAEGDHMYPLFYSRITGFYSDVIVTACQPCNTRKGSRLPARGFVDVWIGRLLVGYAESKFAKDKGTAVPPPAERRIPCLFRPPTIKWEQPDDRT